MVAAGSTPVADAPPPTPRRAAAPASWNPFRRNSATPGQTPTPGVTIGARANLPALTVRSSMLVIREGPQREYKHGAS
jgi:hypothetical protein